MKLHLLSSDRNPWRWKAHPPSPPCTGGIMPPISSTTFSPIFGRTDPSSSYHKVSPAVYNEIVNPPSSSLGIETPDCGKIVFQGRATRVIPRGKRRPPSGKSRDLERKRGRGRCPPPPKGTRRKSKVNAEYLKESEINLPYDESTKVQHIEPSDTTLNRENDINEIASRLRSSKSLNPSKQGSDRGTWAEESQMCPQEKSKSESWREQSEPKHLERQDESSKGVFEAEGQECNHIPSMDDGSCLAERIQFFTDLLCKYLPCNHIKIDEAALKELVIRVMYCKLYCKVALAEKMAQNEKQNVIIFDENGLYFQGRHEREETFEIREGAEENELQIEREIVREIIIQNEIDDEEAARDSGVELNAGVCQELRIQRKGTAEESLSLLKCLVPPGSQDTIKTRKAIQINPHNCNREKSEDFQSLDASESKNKNKPSKFLMDGHKINLGLKANWQKKANYSKLNYFSSESESEPEKEEKWSSQFYYNHSKEEEPRVAFMGGANLAFFSSRQESQLESPVPTRASPRAGKVVHQSSGESEVLYRDSGCYWPLDDDLGEGEFSCTCAMPCKASCIPVYQGRGNNSRDAVGDETPRSRTPSSLKGRGVTRNTPVARSSSSVGVNSNRTTSKENLKAPGSRSVPVKKQANLSKGNNERNIHISQGRSATVQGRDNSKQPLPSQTKTRQNAASQNASKLSAGSRRENTGARKSPTCTPSLTRKEKFNSNVKLTQSPVVKRSTTIQTSARYSSTRKTIQETREVPKPSSVAKPKQRTGNIELKRTANSSKERFEHELPSFSKNADREQQDQRQPKHSASSFSSFDDTITVMTDTSSLNLSEFSMGNPGCDSDGFSEKNTYAPTRKSRLNLTRSARDEQTKSLSRERKEPAIKKINRNYSLNEKQRDVSSYVSRSLSNPRSMTNLETDRAKIVRRVMTSDNKHAKLPPNSNTRTTSNKMINTPNWKSHSPSLGPRNEGLRSSLDSQKTESTTDSGCNSPGYGSQGSLNNDVPSPLIQKKIYVTSSRSKYQREAPLNNKNEAPPKKRTVQVMNQVNKLHSNTNSRATKQSGERISNGNSFGGDNKSKKLDAVGSDSAKANHLTQSSLKSRTSENRAAKSAGGTFMQRYNGLALTQLEKADSKSSLGLLRKCQSTPLPIEEEFKFTNKVTINSNLNDSCVDKICDQKSFDEELKKSQINPPLSSPKENKLNVDAAELDGPKRDLNGINVSFQSNATQVEREENRPNQSKKTGAQENSYKDHKRQDSRSSVKSISITEVSNSPDAIKLGEESHEEFIGPKSTKESSQQHNNINELQLDDVSSECNNNVRIIPVEILATDARPQIFSEPISSLKSTNNGVSPSERSRKKAQSNLFLPSGDLFLGHDDQQFNDQHPDSKSTPTSQSTVSELIDSALLNNLKINGTILSDQFDAIITTLKKVAESMDKESEHLEKVTNEIDNETTFRYGNKEMPYSTPWLKSASLRQEFSDNDYFYQTRPYRRLDEVVDRLPRFNSTIEGPLGNVPIIQHAFQRKNSTGSMGGSPNSNFCSETYSEVAHSTSHLNNDTSLIGCPTYREGPKSFRKVSSAFNINGCDMPNANNSFDNSFLRTESRLRKSLSKSRELLSQLETEYRLLKGDTSDKHSPLAREARKIEGDFVRLFGTYASDSSNKNSEVAEENPSAEVTKQSTTKTLSDPSSSETSRHKRRLSPWEGRGIFSFLQRKTKSQSNKSPFSNKLSLPDSAEIVVERELQTKMKETYNTYPEVSSLGTETLIDTKRSKVLQGGRSPHPGSRSPQLPANINIVITESPSDEKLNDNLGGIEEAHHRSLSLPKSFMSEKHQLLHESKTAPSTIFPWRQGRISSDQRQSNEEQDGDSDAVLVQFKKENEWNERLRENLSEGGLHPRSFVSKEIRREKATSSPAISRSSLSHSEWDIRRPWSEVYVSQDHPSVLSQSVYRLPETYLDIRGGDAPLPFGDEGEDYGVGDDAPLSMPYIVPSENASPVSSEGVFQKFKKSLSLRLVKKTSRSESPEERLVSASPIGQIYETNQPDSSSLSRRSPAREEESKSNFLFGHPIFRSSKERRRAKLRDVRSAKCNSGDSGDSGIELANGSCPYTTDTPITNGISSYINLNNYDTGIVCSTDICEESYQIPSDQPSTLPTSEDLKHQKIIRRTCSDIGGTLLRQGRTTAEFSSQYGRQYSSPQPIKMRPSHKLPNYSLTSNVAATSTIRFRRNKGSTQLRRSVSQPLDLDKSFETQVPFLSTLLREEQEDLSKKQRRPSVGNLLSDDNTSEEEGEASDSEEHPRGDKTSLDDESSIVYAEALWDHVSLDSDELVFKAGDLITVLDSSDKDWWWGRISSRIGWFPSVFVRLLVNQDDHQQKTDSSASENVWITRRLSLTKVSHDQIRANVINEIISTERDFVKHLRDLVEGYLRQVRKRPDMFSKECIATIFGNIEELYIFQSRFLSELEQCIDYDEPFRSCIGECFIRNRANFEAYSEYCNNHPLAVWKLQDLYRQQKFVHFFEACRLLQEMIDISLDGFLLTPVQKICKYPLQLQELLKYTKPSHLDYVMVQGATQAMKEVALLVNERKRRMECLEKIASWQMAVEGWEGPELLDDSSQLIHQGELTKGVGGPWSKEITLFLFDHQAVYCKRDLLKRSTYVYRGRINTDLCEVIDIPDDLQKNVTLFHSWKIHCLDKNKTYVFTCKSASEKEKWLAAFRKERQLVACDEEAGFVVSEKQKQVAKMSAKNHKCKPKKPRTLKPSKRVQAMTFAQAQLLVNTEFESESRSNSLPLGSQPPVMPPDPKKKATWFSFGVHRKNKHSAVSIPV